MSIQIQSTIAQINDIRPAIEEAFNKLKIESQDDVIVHLSKFIALFRERATPYSRSTFLMHESAMSIKRWNNLTQASKWIRSPLFSSISEIERSGMFLGLKGICVGVVAHYLSRFFQTVSPMEASPFPIRQPIQLDTKLTTYFYPFCQSMREGNLTNKTEHSRFLQAAYKISYRPQKKSFEFLPLRILKKEGVAIASHLPAIGSKKRALKMEHLLPTLKQLECHDKRNGYLIALGGSIDHAIAISLQHPFHFMDPTYGIGAADSLEELLLFFVSYLSGKYPSCSTFALVEFTPSS